MSKYIIEIEEKPLCVFDKDTQTYFPRLWRVKGFNSLVLDEEGLSRLEELNSDYINEHYGQLQDDAYQRGLDDAWEAAKKVVLSPEEGGMSTPTLFEIFRRGSVQHVFRNYSASQVIEKLKAYEEKQKAEDEIKVGDIVERYLNGKLDSTGIYLGEDGDYWNCLFWTGAVFGTFAYPKNQFKKTEKHVDIASILEAMKA